MDSISSALKTWENNTATAGKNANDKSSLGTLTKLAVLGVGGYLVWINRFKIQDALETVGISTPWLKGNLGEAVESGAAKINGAIKHDEKSMLSLN